MTAAIYHPETGHAVNVPDEAVPHYQRAGWWLQSEWDAAQAAKAQQEQASGPAKGKAAGGGASGER